MTLDNRTPAERAYDATALSTRTPAQPKEHSPLFYELKDWIDSHFDEEEQAEPIAADPMTKIFEILELIEDESLSAPQPADGHHDIPIGTIDSAVVLGSYMENGKLYAAKVVWQDHQISTDGDTYLNLGLDSEHGCVGDMSLLEWGMSKALAQAGIVEQLIEMARQHATIQIAA